jgi:hypothetical protein
MKPSTAAQKLDVYLPATPPEFQAGQVSREDWTSSRNVTLRSGWSTCAGTVRIRATSWRRACACPTAGWPRRDHEALTTAQIAALIADPPAWLVQERELHAEVRREQQRLRERRA